MGNQDFSVQSISAWLVDLRHGDQQAAQDLWSRYESQLVAAARQKLGHAQTGYADEEDVAQLAFTSLCRGALEGRFQDVSNRDELWWLLLAITKRKAVDLIRHETAQKRGGRNSTSDGKPVRDAASGFTFGDMVASDPTPEYLAALSEQYGRLMASLRDDCLRQVVMWRIEGYTIAEIAEQLQITKRSVERKLQLIRGKWSRELNASGRQD